MNMITLNDNYKGVDYVNARASVGVITIDESHSQITFQLNYSESDTQDSDYYNTEYYSCNYDKSGDDIVSQAYNYLLKLEKFSRSE